MHLELSASLSLLQSSPITGGYSEGPSVFFLTEAVIKDKEAFFRKMVSNGERNLPPKNNRQHLKGK